MFGFLKRWWHGSEESASPQSEDITAPGTGIHYHADLVGRLHDDHKELLRVYGMIKTAFDKGDYLTVSQRLGELRGGLQSHLLTENLLLYVYLDHCLAADETNSELIRGFRHEMDQIGKVAMRFLKKYEAIGVDKDLAPSFAEEFATIGQVLGERIKKEETVLYPLYLPHY